MYAEFGVDGSDVYVYLSVTGVLICDGCCISPHQAFTTTVTTKMIDHLDTHEARGDTVPLDTFQRLIKDAAENDHWMALDPRTRKFTQLTKE